MFDDHVMRLHCFLEEGNVEKAAAEVDKIIEELRTFRSELLAPSDGVSPGGMGDTVRGQVFGPDGSLKQEFDTAA